jgi:hypothetical protein
MRQLYYSVTLLSTFAMTSDPIIMRHVFSVASGSSIHIIGCRLVAYDNTNRNTLFYVVYKVLNTGRDAAGLTSVHTVKPTNISLTLSLPVPLHALL